METLKYKNMVSLICGDLDSEDIFIPLNDIYTHFTKIIEYNIYNNSYLCC